MDEKAFSQLVQVGGDSPEFHLFRGKAHLNLEPYDMPQIDFRIDNGGTEHEKLMEKSIVPSPELTQEPQ